MNTFIILFCLGFKLSTAVLVLPPVHEEGRDVGFVIVAGAYLSNEQYRELGFALQQRSNLRIWVALANGVIYKSDENINRKPEETLVGEAKEALRQQGMPSDAPFFASGHSLGSVTVYNDVQKFPELAQGTIMLGSDTTNGDLFNYPVPLLYIYGDLDGSIRVTKMTKLFRELKAAVDSSNEEAKFFNALSLVEGMNHAQYASGEMPPNVEEPNIEPELTDEDAREEIASRVDVFINYHLQEDATLDDDLTEAIEKWYLDSNNFMTPIITAFDMELNENQTETSWVIDAQFILANLDDTEEEWLMVSGEVRTEDDIGSEQPTIESDVDGKVFVNVYNSVAQSRGIGVYVYEAARMLEAKFKNHAAVESMLRDEDVPLDVQVYCRDVNQQAWEQVYSLMPQKSRDRFDNMNISVMFEDDAEAVWGPGWLNAELEFEFDGSELRIQSTNLVTEIGEGGAQYGGMHYCKLLSPAKALEFMYVDGLRKNPPSQYL